MLKEDMFYIFFTKLSNSISKEVIIKINLFQTEYSYLYTLYMHVDS